MKSVILALGVAVTLLGMVPDPAEARRFGGGGGAGMQRQMPARPAPNAVPAKPAAPAQAAPAAAPKRNWLGPIAGLAAGLGLAALLSHLGLGEEFASFLMLMLLAFVAFMVIRMLMRRFGPQRALGTPQGVQWPAGAAESAMQRSAMGTGAALAGPSAAPGAVAAPYSAAASFAAASPVVPMGFDSEAFERIAKMIFVRMQAANDAGDLNDLRAFTTPEMFASIRVDLQERRDAKQTTDVEQVDAQIVDFVSEDDRQIVSVRFHGMIKEAADKPAAPFDEVWHLVRPTDGSREWAIAGIQQSA